MASAGLEPATGPTSQKPIDVYGTANHGSGQPVAQMVQSGPESCTAPSTTAIGTSRCASLTSQGVPGHTTPLPCSCACIFVCMCLWCVTLLLTGCHAVSRARNRTWVMPRGRETHDNLICSLLCLCHGRLQLPNWRLHLCKPLQLPDLLRLGLAAPNVAILARWDLG